MKNEELLNEIRHLFESFDKDLEEQGKDVAYMKGIIAEMQTHNGRIVKLLAAIITTLLSVIVYLVAK